MLVVLAVVPFFIAESFCNARNCCPNYQIATESGCLANEKGAACNFDSEPRCGQATNFFMQLADAVNGFAIMSEGMDAWRDLPGSKIHDIPPHLLHNAGLFLGPTLPPVSFVLECAAGVVCDMYVSFYECGDCPNKDGGFSVIASLEGWTKVPCQMRFSTGSDSQTRHRLVTYVKNIPSGGKTTVIVPAELGLGFFLFAPGEPCHTYNSAVACASGVAPRSCKWDPKKELCSIGYCPVPKGPFLGLKCSSFSCAYDDVALRGLL